MQSILNLLVKYNHWFLFILLEGISIVLLLTFNNYQNAVFFTSANGIAGNIYTLLTDVDGYFSLKDENRTLIGHNRMLMEEIDALKEESKYVPKVKVDSDETLEDDETVELNRYSVTNNKVVAVTYGDIDENGQKVAKKTFILNYNNYAVSVTYNKVVYTVAAGGYIIVPTATA